MTRPAIFALLLLAACGHSIQLESRYRDRELVIDGADADWGERRYILEDPPISIGVMNDADHLYLMMITADRALQMQVATRGLELWLDPKGGRKQVFGLRLPGVMDGRHGEIPFDGMAPWQDGDTWHDPAGRGSRTGGRGGRPRRGGNTDSIDPRQLDAMFEHLRGSKIVVLDSPSDEGWETTGTVGDAVQVSLAYDTGRLIYEVQVPLTYLGHPHYTIEPSATSGVGIALKVPSVAAMMPQPGERGGSMGGGRGDLIGGTGELDGGRRMDMAGTRPSMGDAFEQWAKIHLADAP